jgi:ATP-dependent Clp protease ATP-binding subunit ClpA
MFSEQLRSALAREVVGQPAAINTVVRGVTRLVSGMTPHERGWCAYLFLGPPGTGRAHLVRSLARILHGEETVISVNCNAGGQPDPWSWFVQQLTPLFASRAGQQPEAGPRAPTIVLVQDLECAHKDFFPLLARTLETGQVQLPGGQRGRFEDCLLVFTTGLCAREILDQTAGFGFPSAPAPEDDAEGDPLLDTCRAEAEQTFGLDLLAQFDNLVLFSASSCRPPRRSSWSAEPARSSWERATSSWFTGARSSSRSRTSWSAAAWIPGRVSSWSTDPTNSTCTSRSRPPIHSPTVPPLPVAESRFP